MNVRALTWLAGLALCVAAWAGAAWGVHVWKESLREEGRAEVRNEWTAAVVAANADQARADAARKAAQETADREHAQAIARLAADAAGARAAEQRVRKQLAAFVAARREASPAQPVASNGPGVEGQDALDLLADLLAGSATALVDLAEHADALRVAGQRCEAGYDAEVTP